MRRAARVVRVCAPVLALLLAGCDEPALERPGTVSVAFEGELVGWSHRTFNERTDYSVVRSWGNGRVLKAVSRNSASILTRAVAIDIRQTPILEFAWRVDAPLAGLDERSPAGNDFAARVYVTFDGAPARREDVVLNYVWSGAEPEGSVWTSPYWEGAKLVAATSGEERAGSWVTVRRDLREDLRAAFGFTLDQVESVAVMTDTDGSGGSTTAWYGTIRFLPE